MARQNRYCDKARREAQVNGRTLRGSTRELSPAMRKLIGASIGKVDFTPADQVRNAARLTREKRNLATAGLSPEVEALVHHHLFRVEIALERHRQAMGELRRLQLS